MEYTSKKVTFATLISLTCLLTYPMSKPDTKAEASEETPEIDRPINMRDTLLTAAVRAHNLPECQRLIAARASVNARTIGNKFTPLHVITSVQNGHVDDTAICELLLESRADLEAFSQGNKRPLEISLVSALNKQNCDIDELLIIYGTPFEFFSRQKEFGKDNPKGPWSMHDYALSAHHYAHEKFSKTIQVAIPALENALQDLLPISHLRRIVVAYYTPLSFAKFIQYNRSKARHNYIAMYPENALKELVGSVAEAQSSKKDDEKND